MEGWKCPGCGRCYAPALPQCQWCGPDGMIDFSKVVTRSWGDTCQSCNCTPCAHTTTGCQPMPPVTYYAGDVTASLDACGPTSPAVGKITFTSQRTGGQ